MQQCPCQKNKLYSECCYPFHVDQKRPQSPLELMKSRYSAYALKLPSYIIETTHPNNPQYQLDFTNWEKEILAFAHTVRFEKLEILSDHENAHEGYVTFRAYLIQGSKDVSFEEKSHFVYDNQRWLYLDGQVKPIKK